jgi:hypothetical protein
MRPNAGRQTREKKAPPSQTQSPSVPKYVGKRRSRPKRKACAWPFFPCTESPNQLIKGAPLLATIDAPRGRIFPKSDVGAHARAGSSGRPRARPSLHQSSIEHRIVVVKSKQSKAMQRHAMQFNFLASSTARPCPARRPASQSRSPCRRQTAPRACRVYLCPTSCRPRSR